MKRIVFFILLMPFLAMAQTKKKPVAKAAGANSSVQQSVSRGEAVYRTYCLSCHQTDGSGVPGLNPPLIQNDWVLGPKNRLVDVVLHGSQGKVEIDGDTYHNLMPALGHLTDQQVADVITYVRKSFGNNASAATPADVKAIRVKAKK
jgi:cbb3-type cytochrome c oxidase subunit III